MKKILGVLAVGLLLSLAGGVEQGSAQTRQPQQWMPQGVPQMPQTTPYPPQLYPPQRWQTLPESVLHRRQLGSPYGPAVGCFYGNIAELYSSGARKKHDDGSIQICLCKSSYRLCHWHPHTP